MGIAIKEGCPKCGWHRIIYDKQLKVYVCANCLYDWRDNAKHTKIGKNNLLEGGK